MGTGICRFDNDQTQLTGSIGAMIEPIYGHPHNKLNLWKPSLLNICAAFDHFFLWNWGYYRVTSLIVEVV